MEKLFIKFLTIVKSLPLWILIGLSLAGYTLLFLPPISGINFEPLRKTWGSWIWVETIVFSILAITRTLDIIFDFFVSHLAATKQSQILRFVPLDRQVWWHLAKQQDDSFASQIHIEIQVTNTSDRPVQILKVRLIRPKRVESIHAEVLLPLKGSSYHSHTHPVLPFDTVPASVHLMLKGKLARQGKPIRVTLGITDQYGTEYRVKNIAVKSHDKVIIEPNPLKAGLEIIASKFFKSRNRTTEQPPVMPWTYDPKATNISICESILQEERRNYTANGRGRGGLGSLNIGLQSEPNLGWTEVGKIPKLLWEKGKGKKISSSNLERLLKTYESLAEPDKENMKRYLLSQLDKKSQFAEVAYFVFCALHRFGATIDALKTARTFLAGDKVYGYSNLLGTLAAIVSNEHFDIDPALYPQVLDVLKGDEENDFRLKEKINLAILEHIDRQ